MHIQEIVCPRCGEFTPVNVVDMAGTNYSPCGKCDTSIAVVIDADGKVNNIHAAGKSITESFIAIVHLREASVQDLQKFDASLEKLEFKKTVRTAGGIRTLPTGCYVTMNHQLTIKQLFERVIKAAEETGKAHETIIFRWDTFWSHLYEGSRPTPQPPRPKFQPSLE